MIVRGWLIIGDANASLSLPSERCRGVLAGPCPDASAYTAGDYVLWRPAGDTFPFTLVCVEIPVGASRMSDDDFPSGYDEIDRLEILLIRSRRRTVELERAIGEVLDAEIGDDAVALRQLLRDALDR